MGGRVCNVVGSQDGTQTGEIRDGAVGVYLSRHASLTMSGVILRNCTASILAEDWSNGISGARAVLQDVRITGSGGAAVVVGRLKVEDVTIDANPGTGISAGMLGNVKAKGLTVTGNASSANCQVYGCEGTEAGSISGRDVIVRDNVGIGIHAKKLRLHKSTVLNNLVAGSPRDVITREVPRLHGVDCGISLDWQSVSPSTWNVCWLDHLL